jgi:hypothetical protein
MTKEKILNFHQKNQMHERKTGHNSTYPKGGVSCTKNSFVVDQTFVFQIKFCGKSPALRVAANRYKTLNNTLKNKNSK